MTQRSLGRYLLGILLCFFLVSVTSCKKKNRDGDIQTAFASKAQSDPNLAGVSATVLDGTVTLTGTCADENCRTNAEKVVKDIDGVDKVVNNIQVAKVEVNDDANLRTAVDGVIKSYAGVQADVSGGVVTLRGTIQDNAKLQDLMMAVNALRPKRVDNQLVIKNK
jgi:osmotically-inducible protein OsmY